MTESWRDRIRTRHPRPTLANLDASPEPALWCCNGNAEDCALCTDPNPPYPFLCPGHPQTTANERIVGEAREATEATERTDLRGIIADALRASWDASAPNTHRDEAIRRDADAVLTALLGPIPTGFDTASWTAVRAIQFMNEAGQQRDAAQARVRALEAEVAAARKFAGEMRDFCSPHGVATDYADRLIEVMDRAKGEQS